MSKFLKVQCECGNESVVFGDSKSDVFCPQCGNQIVSSKGGRAKVSCKIVEVLSR